MQCCYSPWPPTPRPWIKCNFAYLEKPQVRGENGRLRMTARFSGRSAVSLVLQVDFELTVK